MKNEEERRKKISSSLKAYFQTDNGIIHKNKLRLLQAKRMANYAKFLAEYNNNKKKEL